MSGYIIHFDNETELVHYGVKGMQWKKGKKSVKPFVGTPDLRRKKHAFEKKIIRKNSKQAYNDIREREFNNKKINKSYYLGKGNKMEIDDTGVLVRGNRANSLYWKAVLTPYKKTKTKQIKKNTKKGKNFIEKWFKKIF